VIDARPYKKAFARFANDARGISRIPGLHNNAYYEQEGKKIYITAARNIKAGEEILVGYGKEYWDSMKYNWELDKKKKATSR
jgi:SET domain-containing protein